MRVEASPEPELGTVSVRMDPGAVTVYDEIAAAVERDRSWVIRRIAPYLREILLPNGKPDRARLEEAGLR